MNSNSFSIMFLFISIFLIFSLCVFVPSLSQYGNISTYIPNNLNTNIDINTSIFIWPTPRL